MEDKSSDRFADSKAFLMELSSGSSKRAKAPGNSITQSVSCLVDGCNWDLSHCKEYHRRHKVCQLHSKAPKVTIGGREQRFCQQCSRFHSLVEFDEGKRSCRKRLDCHNRRRRKPPSELLSRINTGRFSCNQQGSTLLSFNSPQVLIPSALMGPPTCAPFYINQNDDIARSTAQSRGGGNRFQILMGNDPSLSEVSTCQPLLDSSFSPRNSESSRKLLYDNRALSLLSSARSETREIGLTHMVQPEPMSLDQPSIQNLHYSGLDQYSFSQGVESNSDFNSNQNVLYNGPDGPSASEPHQQTLSFMWE